MLGATLLATLFLHQGGTNPNVLVVTASAEQTFPADAVTVSLAAKATNASRDSAVSSADKLLARAKVAAREVVVDSANYSTTNSSVSAEYEEVSVNGGLGGPSAKEPAVKKYVANSWLRLHSVRFDQMDTLTKAIAKVDGASVDVVEYGLRDESAARKAVLKAAFLKAKSRAEEAAEAAGLRLGGVALLEVGNGAVLRSGVETNGISPGQPGYRVVPSKWVTVEAAINVRFFIG